MDRWIDRQINNNSSICMQIIELNKKVFKLSSIYVQVGTKEKFMPHQEIRIREISNQIIKLLFKWK